MGLPASEDLGGSEIFQIFVVSNNIDRSSAAFQVLLPTLDSFKDHKEFFVIYVVIEFSRVEGAIG